MKRFVFIFFVFFYSLCLSAKPNCLVYLKPWSLYTSVGYGSFNQLSQKNLRDWDYSAPYEINMGSRFSDQIYNSKAIVDLGFSYSKYVGFFSGPHIVKVEL